MIHAVHSEKSSWNSDFVWNLLENQLELELEPKRELWLSSLSG